MGLLGMSRLELQEWVCASSKPQLREGLGSVTWSEETENLKYSRGWWQKTMARGALPSV